MGVGRDARSEWAVNMHRDTYASHIGHEDMLYFVSVADNESVERVRYTMLEVGFADWIQDRKCCSPADLLPQRPTPCTECVFCLFCLLPPVNKEGRSSSHPYRKEERSIEPLFSVVAEEPPSRTLESKEKSEGENGTHSSFSIVLTV